MSRVSSNPGVDAPYGNKDDDSEQKVCNAFHRMELSVQRSNYPPKPLKRQADYLLRSSRYPRIYPCRCSAVSKGAARPCVWSERLPQPTLLERGREACAACALPPLGETCGL